MILPENIPYLKQEAERSATTFIYKVPDSKWIGSPSGYAILNRIPQPVDGQTVSRFLSLHSDLSYHESRFLAARWLESIGRPGWRFLDGPSALTAEQSARVLYEACIRSRDGATAIVGVVGAWQADDTRAVLVKPPEIPDWVTSLYKWQGTPTDEQMAGVGWFCL